MGHRRPSSAVVGRRQGETPVEGLSNSRGAGVETESGQTVVGVVK